MSDQQQVHGIPVDDLIAATEGKIRESDVWKEPSIVWIGLLKAMEQMLELFKGEVQPQEIEPLLTQVIALERILSSFETEAMELRLFAQAEEKDLTYGQYLVKLEEAGVEVPRRSA